ncbi:MAG: Sporulation kinase [Planctomycetota bacterium]|jgi:pSer/pThr/pTyr-binding forkhead associated (FHA) protein
MDQPGTCKIRILNGPYRGREKTVSGGGRAFTIGRDAEASIQILDRAASRFHCEIFPVGGMWFVRDLESKNGTHVNDDRLEDEELLRPGDVIRIGKTELVFEAGAAVSDEDSSARVSYQDDPELLSHTLEFRVDELSDLSEPADSSPVKDGNKGLRILYQVARILSDPGADGEREARVLEVLLATLPAECALIFRRDAATGKLVPSTVRTSGPHVQPVISRSIVKKTFTENKALHSADAREDSRFDRHASIHAKDIRSVLCVPLPVSGQTRGVLYLSRGPGQSAFEAMDLELASACALQVGLAQQAGEERLRHRETVDRTVAVLAAAAATAAGHPGLADRAAAAATALAGAMGLDEGGRARLRRAGWLQALLPGGDQAALAASLEHIEPLAEAAALAQQARERTDGSGPLGLSGEDLDTEVRALAVAAAWAAAVSADPGAEPESVIARLRDQPGLDPNAILLLQGCHLDGSLYRT